MPVFDFLRQSTKNTQSKRFEEIPIDKIIPNPNQPRTVFYDDTIYELAQSISQVGLIQPLLVRKVDTHYELIAGERRLRACKQLEFEVVPCVVQSGVDTEESAVMALIENLQRENLSYLEEAQCYAMLLENYSLTQEQLASRLGRSQSGIANKLRLLKLPESVAQKIYEAGLTERHAREILRLRDEESQLTAVQEIASKGLSVKETERMIEKTLDSGKGGKRPRPAILRVMRDYKIFVNTINSAVAVLRDAGLDVSVEQTDRENGVDISISVTNNKQQ